MAKPLFESKPRWPGARLVCLATNLMGFESEKEMKQYQKEQCPMAHIQAEFVCNVCGKHHFDATAPDPGETSASGATRQKKETDKERLAKRERTKKFWKL